MKAEAYALGCNLEVPNLDCLSDDPADLKEAAQLFGLLSCYCDAKANALRMRQRGDIEAALRLEQNAEQTYKELPQWAKW